MTCAGFTFPTVVRPLEEVAPVTDLADPVVLAGYYFMSARTSDDDGDWRGSGKDGIGGVNGGGGDGGGDGGDDGGISGSRDVVIVIVVVVGGDIGGNAR